MNSLKTVTLARDLERPLGSGHPWVYRDALPPTKLRTGEWMRLVAGRSTAFGVYDEDGPIAVRVFSRQEVPDRDWFAARAREALGLREAVASGGNDTYRLVHGEGDGVPGVVLDRYGRHAILKAYSPGVREAAGQLVNAITSQVALRGVSERRETGLEPVYGELPPPELTVTENGLELLVNPYEGQKTGLFLDQRDNRATVRRLAPGRTVLNLFSYNGGFSVAALAGGARSVVSVDVSGPALRDAERTVERNGFEPSKHRGVAADVFEYLSEGAGGAGAADGDRFGLVVCDPPSFAHAKRSRHAALRAYRRLNALALARVEPGGLLATSSCTGQVSPEEFRKAVAQAADQAKVRAQVIHEAGHPADHPVPAHFPEGRYLKFLVLRVLKPC